MKQKLSSVNLKHHLVTIYSVTMYEESSIVFFLYVFFGFDD